MTKKVVAMRGQYGNKWEQQSLRPSPRVFDVTGLVAEDDSYQPNVIIVLVNWNGLTDTRECLDALSHVTYNNFFVVVVDNASQGDDAAQIRTGYPHVGVIEAGRNLGFTGGNNLGIKHALAQGADYILCLNVDTMVAPDFLSLMVEAAEKDPMAGVITSAIFYYSEPARLCALGCWLDFRREGIAGHISDVNSAVWTQNAVEVPFAEGCVLMLRRATAETIGGFDDNYFAYLEDADLCLRARAHGWRCIAVPAAHVWHKVGSLVGGQHSPTANFYYQRNMWRLIRSHGTAMERLRFYGASWQSWHTDWMWFCKQCVLCENMSEDKNRQQALLRMSLNTISGLLGWKGTYQRCRSLEKPFQLFLHCVIVTYLALGKIVHPAYRLWRTKHPRANAEY